MMLIVGTCIALVHGDMEETQGGDGAEDSGGGGGDGGYGQQQAYDGDQGGGSGQAYGGDQGGYGQEQGYAAQNSYESQPTYHKPKPADYVTVVERPSSCGCNRHKPCFDRKANKCVAALSGDYGGGGGRAFAVKKGGAAPKIKLIKDPYNPNAIIIGVDTLGMDVVDDDEPTGGLPDTSANDGVAANPYAQVAYGDAYYETICLPAACPAHTHRCEDFNQMRKWGSIAVFVEFILALLVALKCIYEAWVRSSDTRMWFAVAAVITSVSFMASLVVMLGGGYHVRCWDQRHFYWVRYIEWMLTAPQILWILQAGSGQRWWPGDSFAPIQC